MLPWRKFEELVSSIAPQIRVINSYRSNFFWCHNTSVYRSFDMLRKFVRHMIISVRRVQKFFLNIQLLRSSLLSASLYMKKWRKLSPLIKYFKLKIYCIIDPKLNFKFEFLAFLYLERCWPITEKVDQIVNFFLDISIQIRVDREDLASVRPPQSV